MISSFRYLFSFGLLLSLTETTAAFTPALLSLQKMSTLEASRTQTWLSISVSNDDDASHNKDGDDDNNNMHSISFSRRSLLQSGMKAAMACTVVSVVGATMMPSVAFAAAAEEKIPMITLDEFLIILRDSARSIQRVEFSGAKAETVRVRLIDGTQFGIKDIVESSTDPRSPLKVQAACREAKVPFKNLEMERFLANAPKKTKVYTNQRVQEAAAKEKERLERLAKDEEARLAELYKMEQQEAMK